MSIPYMSDPTLVPRVQKYLELNVDKTYVDINEMADQLQAQYREYARRKRRVFRAAVNKAYSIVLSRYGMNEDQDQSEDGDTVNSGESSIDPGDNTHEQLNDTMNDQMIALYSRKYSVQKSIDENELIDISSDDDEAVSNTVDKVFPNKNGTELTITAQPIPDSSDRGKKRKQPHSTPMKFPPSKKKKPISRTSIDSTIKFKDVGGMDETLLKLSDFLLQIKHPELYKELGITPPTGFLLHGPPGCGKTLLADVISGELNIPLVKVAAPELVAGVSGESEARIRELFEQALRLSPCVLFIDEIDAITQHRQNAQKDMEKRIVAQLVISLDELDKKEMGRKILTIGATNRPDSIDPAIRRTGRFEKEISIGIPNKKSRCQILKVLTRKLKLSDNFDFDLLASLTPGYVGADLLSLCKVAASVAVNRMLKQLKEADQKEEEENDAAAAAAAFPTTTSTGKEKENPTEVSVQDVEIESLENEQTHPADADTIEVIDTPCTAGGANKEKADAAGAVVIIDDDPLGKGVDSKPQEKLAEPARKRDISKRNALSPLEEMLAWIHDPVPLSEEELAGFYITMEDFEESMRHMQPSSKREGFATVPDTTWEDVGSLRDIREELQMSILAPVRYSELFEKMGYDVPSGVLLFGPPGCGKTLLAKAIANEAGINFISVKGPELLNMYVGESERAVRMCFQRASNSAPCVIFFDELDSLCSNRSTHESNPTNRVVNQLLTEMDGVSGRNGVFLLAATNRPDIIDPAILRPGRIGKLLYVGLPTASDRADILRAITRNGTRPELAPDVSLESIAESKECEGFTGADLKSLVREAVDAAVRDALSSNSANNANLCLSSEHFKRAFRKVRGSVSLKSRKRYEEMRKMYSSDRKDSEEEDMELT